MTAEETNCCGEGQNTVEMEGEDITTKKDGGVLKEGKYKQASVQYRRIASWLEYNWGLEGDEGYRSKARALRLVAQLNLSVCYLKMQEQGLALESCNKALELDSSSEKALFRPCSGPVPALFRRGEALFAMKEFERARDDFQRVLQLYPANKAAKAQVVVCQRQIKEQRQKDKRLYANMFQNFAKRDEGVRE